jgi:quinol monooxygenase YgiN
VLTGSLYIVRLAIDYTGFHQKKNLWRKRDFKEYLMSISRIGETHAKEGSNQALRDFLISIMPMIKSSEGCESVQLYQSQDDPSKFIMIEIWDNIESHQASVKNIPAEKLGEIRPLLAGSPSGSYFQLVDQK